MGAFAIAFTFAVDVDGDGAGVGDLYQHSVSHDNSGMALICPVEGLPPDRPTIRCTISQNGRERLRWRDHPGLHRADEHLDPRQHRLRPHGPRPTRCGGTSAPDTPLVAHNIRVGKSSPGARMIVARRLVTWKL
ncbi:hypothetical protein GCM10012285_12170 [Streptomyces kronopolitis]|uniref:Uncharacterized protein n=1 Tax=Streptomyces kronopolitis TaxID=1612435 RepID=A0ABQ2J567_9ACTN|nr:hypothetical protein [Streptomyces kronopolitis]GGN37400.1 hypothetical protein GCM10012285_12170 [Streptomyces kronopolitis]